MTVQPRVFGATIAFAIVFSSVVPRGAGGVISGSVTIPGATSNADAVVFIEQAAGPFSPTEHAVLNQKSQEFMPRVLPVVVGTTVMFLNNDPTSHNVFSPDYEKYDLGTWKQGDTKEHLFAECGKPPCAYTQLCMIHPQMSAFIVVLQNPFFAVTDKTGHYQIDNVPSGDHTLAVWYTPRRGRPYPIQRKAITLQTDSLNVDFTVGR